MLVEFIQNRIAKLQENAYYSKDRLSKLGLINNKDYSGSLMSDYKKLETK